MRDESRVEMNTSVLKWNLCEGSATGLSKHRAQG